jgi:hypothetical protein
LDKNNCPKLSQKIVKVTEVKGGALCFSNKRSRKNKKWVKMGESKQENENTFVRNSKYFFKKMKILLIRK